MESREEPCRAMSVLFFGALRVAGHGTGSARSGVDIGCSHKRVGAFCRFGIMGFEIWKQEGERVR